MSDPTEPTPSPLLPPTPDLALPPAAGPAPTVNGNHLNQSAPASIQITAKGAAGVGGVSRGGLEAAEESEEDRARLIEKVEESTRRAKLVRAFQHRLALAAFKHSRGWEAHPLDMIEPALAQEAAQKQLAQQQQQQAQQAAQQLYSQPAYPPSDPYHPHPYSQDTPTGPPAKRFRPDNGSAHPSPAYPMPGGMPSSAGGYTGPGYGAPDYGSYHPGSYHPHSTPGGYVGPLASTSALPLGGYGPSPGASNPFQSGGVAPPHAHHPHPNGNGLSGGYPSSTSTHMPARAHSTQGGPRTNQPISSSDPNFSSFVDAASVLSGLNGRNGSEAGGAPGEPTDVGDRTPPRNKGKGVANGTAGGGGEGNNSADAAELMLYLAASPSPVQSKASVPNPQLLGGASPVRGRRLFSGEHEADPAPSQSVASVFGDFHQNGAFAQPNHSRHSPPPLHHPTPGSHHASYLGHGLPPSMAAEVSTPRDRQPSFGAPGGAWETYVNASPSPSPGKKTLPAHAAGRRADETGSPRPDRSLELDEVPVAEDLLKHVPQTSLAFLQDGSPGENGSGEEKRPFAVPRSAAKLAKEAKERGEAAGVAASVEGEGEAAGGEASGEEWP